MPALMAEAEPPTGLRERKKRETRDRIVLAAFELFQTRGYDETTLSQIADRAQVAVRTVSNYFPQKVDLLVAYRQDMLSVLEESLRRTRIQDRFRADLLEVVAAADLRDGVDRQLAVLVLAASHLAVIQRWAGGEGPSLTTSVERMFDLWVQGVAPPVVG